MSLSVSTIIIFFKFKLEIVFLCNDDDEQRELFCINFCLSLSLFPSFRHKNYLFLFSSHYLPLSHTHTHTHTHTHRYNFLNFLNTHCSGPSSLTYSRTFNNSYTYKHTHIQVHNLCRTQGGIIPIVLLYSVTRFGYF